LNIRLNGKKHDKKIADEEGYEFPEGSKVWQILVSKDGLRWVWPVSNRRRSLAMEN
jgi:hypothetical protein